MVLAITGRLEKKENAYLYFVRKDYIDMLEKLNVLAIPIYNLINIDYISDICDALIVTGGNDINPNLYGELSNSDKNIIDNYADKLDFQLIKTFSNKNKAILGICRGIQSINVYFGGSLYQDINGHGNDMHTININKDTFLFDCYNKEKIDVNSYHHQAIKNVADGFKVSAISSDGIIEGIEKGNIIGVEWHPEKMDDLDIFKNFIDVCKK